MQLMQIYNINNIENKAEYRATLVACGWAGAVLEVTRYLGRSRLLKKLKNAEKI